MNRETLSGNWLQIKGLVHTQWAKLTDNDVLEAQGRFESLVGAIQLHYGLTKEKAESAVDSFLATIDDAKSA